MFLQNDQPTAQEKTGKIGALLHTCFPLGRGGQRIPIVKEHIYHLLSYNLQRVKGAIWTMRAMMSS